MNRGFRLIRAVLALVLVATSPGLLKSQVPASNVSTVPQAKSWSGRLPSLDGRYVLYGVAFEPGVNDSPQLWIQQTFTGTKRLLFNLSRTITAQWAPDSTAFFVNDEFASDGTEAYIYEVPSFNRLKVSQNILAADSSARNYARGHAYFDADGWLGSKRIAVRFHGHTDNSPVTCFEFRYIITRDGTVTKGAEVVGPIGQVPCS